MNSSTSAMNNNDTVAGMSPTELVYLSDKSLRGRATVLGCERRGQTVCVTLDRTLFYPQGGGQPFDQGTLTSVELQGGGGGGGGTSTSTSTSTSMFQVKEVRFVDGVVQHLGEFVRGEPFAVRTQVELTVDGERRLLNSRLHSAGHLIPVALRSCGLANRELKGFHFPEGPYVEFDGAIEPSSAPRIAAALAELVSRDLPVTTELVADLAEVRRRCAVVPEGIPTNKPVRVVSIGQLSSSPCGGTHVDSLGQLGVVTVRKISTQKGKSKIAYSIPMPARAAAQAAAAP